MKIPLSLFQFIKKKSLIIVSGDRIAEFYFAHEGYIDHIYTLSLFRPVHRDERGFFIKKEHGVEMKVGANYENMEEYIDKKYMKIFQRATSDLTKDVQTIYLFLPEDMKNQIYASLPKISQKKVRMLSVGNYTKFHPKKIVQMITEREKVKKNSHKK